MPASRSNIKVEVTFKNPVVFAGESLNAIITFKNLSDDGNSVSNGPGHQRYSSAFDASFLRKPRQRQVGQSADLSNGRGGIDGTEITLENDNENISSESSGLTSPNRSIANHVQDEEDSSWLSSRRLSMQLANSFREFYGGSNKSSTGVPGSNNGEIKPSTGLNRSASTITRGSNVVNSNANSILNSKLSSLRSSVRATPPINLLMGFIQLQGYFQIDDTIISSDSFERVKTQGIVIGRNGLEYRSKSGETGLLKGLTTGFGSFFKSDNTPSINGSNDNNPDNPSDIPIFSTPQSLLFVDLKLLPGESKSFSYQLILPKSLPPSCRGKAISIYYNLVIGTQKPSSKGIPEPKIVLVPFRVFPFVDSSGKQPCHNLTEPIVLRKDDSIITQLADRRPSVKSFEQLEQKQKLIAHDSLSFKKSKDEFTNYLEDLLTNGLLTDDENHLKHRSSIQAITGQDEYTARENIDYFIKYYQQIHQQQQQQQEQHRQQHQQQDQVETSISESSILAAKVSFDINLKGHRIAFIYLSKPIYRIGEDIILSFDFTSSLLNCHHITATLETTERVASTISLKSDQEISSLTRRIFAHSSISTFSSSKTYLQFTIPSTSTPQFNTSDISLAWSVKIDFVTGSPRLSKDHQALLRPAAAPTNLSSIFTAKSALPCETFSCRIPIQVYPTNQDIKPLVDHHSGMMNRKWVI